MIDHAVENEASEQLVDADGIAKPCDHHGFEDAKTGRHMAEDAEADRGGVDCEECRPAEMRVGQEDIKHGGGGGDIEGGDEELARRCPAVREAQPPFAEPDRVPVTPDIGRHHENRDDGERRTSEDDGINADNGGDARCNDEGGDGADRKQAKPEGQRDEGDDAGDFAGRQAQPGIGAKADGATAQRAETGGIADGIGRKGCCRHGRKGQLAADIFDRIGIIEYQRQKAERGENDGEQHRRSRGLRQRIDDVVITDFGGQVIDGEGHHHEDQRDGNRGQIRTVSGKKAFNRGFSNIGLCNFALVCHLLCPAPVPVGEP
ncbi:hypothetical protein D3C71_1275860 [compost metagenome]